MGLDLFEENGDDVNEISKIKVNQEFARKYEYNKRREDLQRLRDLKKHRHAGEAAGSESSSEAETEDDDGILLPENDLKFYEVLAKVKKNDPSLLQKDVKLFPSDDEDEDADDSEGDAPRMKERKKKPLYLKDVIAKQLMANGPEIKDDVPKMAPKTYVEEQEEIRQAVLNAAKGAFISKEDDEGDFFKEKNTKENKDSGSDDRIAEVLEECFNTDNPDETAFWKDYLLNKQWICKDQQNLLERDAGLSDENDELEEQDRYELEYNFRFEEGASDQVMGFSRRIEGSVRKKDSARKSQRTRKKERSMQAEFEREEELKRLKNVKKQELLDKLERIRNVAGIGKENDLALNEKDLEDEFDPDEFDRKMKETFDEKYYEAEDVNADFHSDGVDDLEKPDFEREDELLGLPKGWDEFQSGEGFSTTRERVLKLKKGSSCEVAADEMEAIGDADAGQNELEIGGKKKKVQFSLEDQVSLEKELDEYYKLDYEGTIGDLKTRFKYRSVPSNRYGLSAAEILMADDKDLNQYVSLKKLAPYRLEEFKIPKQKRHHRKQKILLSLRETLKSQAHKIRRKRKMNGHDIKTDGHKKKHRVDEHDGKDSFDLKGKPKLEESNVDAVQLSRRAKRRRRQSELKIPQSRLMAYGQVPAKSKKTKMHQSR